MRHQIILCGLLLVNQLVASEHYKHTIFTANYCCNEQISFDDIQRQLKRKIPTVDAAFDAIEKELKRPAGTRVEQLLKNVFFGLLQEASEVAAKPDKKDKIEK